jgi:uncharacterized protein (DUF1330 family)
VRGGAMQVLEGDATPNRRVVIEFASMEQLKGFYFSAEYQALAKIRQSASVGNIVAVEGV